MIQLLAPPSPRILTLQRARGQERAVPLPSGDGLSDKRAHGAAGDTTVEGG